MPPTADKGATVGDLKTQIYKEFKFSPETSPELISLSAQMAADGDEGSGAFSDLSTPLVQLGIKHGSMLYVTSKLKQTIIEKSYVGEDGNAVVEEYCCIYQ